MTKITHRCSDGTAHELEQGRYLPDAEEYRTVCPNGCVVYNDGEIEHE